MRNVPARAFLPGQCQTGHKCFCERPEFRRKIDLLCFRWCCRRGTVIHNRVRARPHLGPQANLRIHNIAANNFEATDAITAAHVLGARVALVTGAGGTACWA
jgi:hypothetical protein